MAKFMFVYRGGQENYDEATPEQMQQMMQLWMDWIQVGNESGLDG